MANMIFVNVPVRDLRAAMAYYKALGFDHNPQFTDETAACSSIWGASSKRRGWPSPQST